MSMVGGDEWGRDVDGGTGEAVVDMAIGHEY